MNETNNSSVALQAFTFEDTTIRAGMDDDEPWFVAKDIAVVLGYSLAPHMLRTLDDDEKGIRLVGYPWRSSENGDYHGGWSI